MFYQFHRERRFIKHPRVPRAVGFFDIISALSGQFRGIVERVFYFQNQIKEHKESFSVCICRGNAICTNDEYLPTGNFVPTCSELRIDIGSFSYVTVKAEEEVSKFLQRFLLLFSLSLSLSLSLSVEYSAHLGSIAVNPNTRNIRFFTTGVDTLLMEQRLSFQSRAIAV